MQRGLDFSKDRLLLNDFNADIIVGIDEVGRGAWAGPVCVGAYVLDLNNHTQLEGVNDSKLINPTKRHLLSNELSKSTFMVLTGDLNSINSIGIGKTISNLITDAVNKLTLITEKLSKKAVFIIDGQFSVNFGDHTLKQNKADCTYYSVAAASIIAKVYRDKLMQELHNSYNHYGFNNNKGYPTKYHLNALKLYGVSPIHRTSFSPISNQLNIFNEKYKD